MTSCSSRDPQSGLFGAPPRPAAVRDLEIVPRGPAPLGKEQLAFNKLIRKVNALREKLAEWEAFEPRHHQRTVSELLPLQRRFHRVRREMILTVGAILAGKAGGGVRKGERRDLEAFLLELAQVHLAEDPEDAEIVALHDAYAPISFAEDRELDREIARSMAEELFGVELDDEEAGGTLEDILEASFAKIRAAAEEEAEAERVRREQRRKTSARARQKGEAAEKAAQEVSQSVREVFRKLASALHPDRAADEADRVRRHALMQRVNHAYDKGDLLSLLTLQLETEQIDAEHLAQVSKARLGHYNKVLRDQLRELEQELAAVAGRFRMLLARPSFHVTPADVERALECDIAGARREIRDLEAHHAMLAHAEPRRRWLKDYAKARREEERMDDAILDELERDAPFLDDEELWGSPFGAAPPRPATQRKPAKRRKRRG